MKRLGGYKIVTGYSYIGKPKAGMYSKAIITDGKNNYIFKELQDIEAYRELYYSKILKCLELPTVEYDLAMRCGLFGVITPFFEHDLNNNHSLKEMLDLYYKDTNNSDMYCLEKIREVIEYAFKKYNWEYNEEIDLGILKQFIIQILLANVDLNPTNIEIYFDEEAKLFPFYDFALCGEVNLKHIKYGYDFKYKRATDNSTISPRTTLQEFIINTDRKNLELFKEYLERMKEVRTRKILDEIKEQTETKIPLGIKLKLQKELKRNISNIESIVKGNIIDM